MRIAMGDTKNRSASGLQKRSRCLVVRLAFQHLSAQLKAVFRDLDEGMLDRGLRLEHALLAIREELVPHGEYHLARHQQAGSVEVGLPLHPLLCLARPTDELGRTVITEKRCLRRIFLDQVLMQPPVTAALMRQSEAIAAFAYRVLLGIEAFVDEDAAVAVDRAENVGLPVFRPRDTLWRA
jgi:hypothetical protein